ARISLHPVGYALASPCDLGAAGQAGGIPPGTSRLFWDGNCFIAFSGAVWHCFSMPLPAEFHDVQAALDELHTRLQEIVGYGSIIVGCTPEGDMLREFTGYIMASAERAQQMGLALNQHLVRLNEVLASLPADFSGTPGLSNRLTMDIAVPPDPHAAAEAI